MKMIRTKGPWLFGEPFAGKYSIYGDMGRRDPDLIAAVTSLVDAQFILAAPEMYEFIKKMRSEMACVCKLNKIVASLGAGIECKTCVMDALIRKAEGL